jgi:hypothetical protein
MKQIYILITIAIIVLTGCAAHTAIEPVGKGNMRADLNFGGPFVNAFDTYIPIPYLSTGVDYGVSDNMDVNANLHLLPLAYDVAGLDLSGAWYPVMNKGIVPTVGLQARLMMLTSFKSDVGSRFRAYPILSASAAWNAWLGKFYLGSDFIIPFTHSDFDKQAASVLLSPFVGYAWNLSTNYSLFTEVKWQGANVPTYQLAVEYIHPSNNGALGIFLSLERRF